jgi:hypothetical protein
MPDGYDRSRAATIVYVHGFFANVDDAWDRYRLADQFAASHVDALFIAPEAPASGDDPVSWESLTDLLGAVRDQLGQPLPRGPIVAVGHSGAHLTVKQWLDDPDLRTIVLLDAPYEVESFQAWVEASDEHRLIDVGPDGTRASRSPRIVYVREDTDHMELITGGVVLPKTLRALRLPQLRRPRPRASGSAS